MLTIDWKHLPVAAILAAVLTCFCTTTVVEVSANEAESSNYEAEEALGRVHEYRTVTADSHSAAGMLALRAFGQPNTFGRLTDRPNRSEHDARNGIGRPLTP